MAIKGSINRRNGSAQGSITRRSIAAIQSGAARVFSAFINLIFSAPSSRSSSQVTSIDSRVEFPQIIVAPNTILSTEDNNILVTKRNDNINDEVTL